MPTMPIKAHDAHKGHRGQQAQGDYRGGTAGALSRSLRLQGGHKLPRSCNALATPPATPRPRSRWQRYTSFSSSSVSHRLIRRIARGVPAKKDGCRPALRLVRLRSEGPRPALRLGRLRSEGPRAHQRHTTLLKPQLNRRGGGGGLRCRDALNTTMLKPAYLGTPRRIKGTRRC